MEISFEKLPFDTFLQKVQNKLTENLGFIEAVGVYAIGATLASIVTLMYHPFHSLRVL